MASPLDHCGGLPERGFDAGEVLIQEGVPGPLFVLAEGAVEILKGNVRISVVREPGAIFGEVSALLGIPPTASVKAIERTRTFVADDGIAFLSARPELTLMVARMLAQRLTSVTSDLAAVRRRFDDQKR